jgi:hypothetical protein
VARFLSTEWVDEFNAALAGIELPGPADDAGLAAADGVFVAAQEVRGAPEGDVRLLLIAGDRTLEVDVEPLGARSTDGAASDHGPVGVTIALTYEDAAALSAGTLTPAEALSAGRVRVRGDLSVLVAAQRLLEAALASVAGTLTTTY